MHVLRESGCRSVVMAECSPIMITITMVTTPCKHRSKSGRMGGLPLKPLRLRPPPGTIDPETFRCDPAGDPLRPHLNDGSR